MSLADELRRLQELHAGGALTDEEYAQAKARVINDAPAPPKEAPRPAERPAPQRRAPERAEPPARSAPPTKPGNPFMPVIIIGLVILPVVLGFAFFWAVKEFAIKPKGGLTLKVDRVENAGDGFRVHMTATNNTKDTLRLPLFGYFFVTDDLGNQYEADPFASSFPQDVAPGATVSGYALMKKPLHPDAKRLKVAFTTVFGSFAVRSAEVADVPVR